MGGRGESVASWEEASSLARPSLVEVRVGPLGPLCTERGQQVACWLCARERRGFLLHSVEMFNLPRPPGLQGIRDPSGGQVTGSVAWGALQDSPHPLTSPSSAPRSALAGSFGISPNSLSKVCFFLPSGCWGGTGTCWPRSERKEEGSLTVPQGALPEGVKAASLDPVSPPCRMKDFCDV